MQLVCRLLLVLLVISLPGYGWAFTDMPACSMQHEQMPHGSQSSDLIKQSSQNKLAVTASANHADDCCIDRHIKNSDKSNHACGENMQCQCSVLYQTTQPFIAPTIPATHVVIHASPFHLITTVAMPLWRPPTLV